MSLAFNILIVDDSATARAIIIKTLQIAQIPVNQLFEASNGKLGLDVLRDHWIDLVFADLHMPVMDGLEMIERMAVDGLLATVPVIVVSSEGSETRIEELRARGVHDYVRKPITPERLSQIAFRALGVAHAG